jgi:hypothetical protein
MKLTKGDKYKDYIGTPCFISYIKENIVKLSFIEERPHVEVWDKQEFIEQIALNRFFPQPKTTINRTNIQDHLIEYQLNMVGKTIDDAKKDEMWYHNITMTSKQQEVFKSYAIPLLRKVFKFNKQKAENTFSWFNLQYGLRIKD